MANYGSGGSKGLIDAVSKECGVDAASAEKVLKHLGLDAVEKAAGGDVRGEAKLALRVGRNTVIF